MKREWQYWSGWNIITIFLLLFFLAFAVIGADNYVESNGIDRAALRRELTKGD